MDKVVVTTALRDLADCADSLHEGAQTWWFGIESGERADKAAGALVEFAWKCGTALRGIADELDKEGE